MNSVVSVVLFVCLLLYFYMNSVCIGFFYRRRSVNIFRNRISTLKYGRSFNEALTVVEKMVVRLMFS